MSEPAHAAQSVSVVVPVYNGASTITRTLQALFSQSYPEYEVIVVDDGSTDATSDIVRGFPVRYLHQMNAGPAAARNAGWRAAQSPIIAFTDSDCLPRTNWIEQLVVPFGEDRGVGGVGGTYVTENIRSTLARLIGLEIQFRHQRMGRYVDAIGSYSAAFRREVLLDVGGFDESFPKASGEDWDLSFKVIQAGFRLAHQPTAIVAHYHTESFHKYLREQYTHGKWRMVLYRRHPTKVNGDSYTGEAVKYQVALSGLCVASLPLGVLAPRPVSLVPGIIALLAALSGLPLCLYTAHRDPIASLISLPMQFMRSFAWLLGALAGLLITFRSHRSPGRPGSAGDI